MCSMKVTIALMTLACVTLAYAEPPASNYLPPSEQYVQRQYIPPQAQPSSYNPYAEKLTAGNNGGYGGYENSEPARYNFEYNVQDYQSGNDFGHKESRDGDLTTGRYYVLLPDGRKQIVTYEADQNGYRPTITYEQSNSGYNNQQYNSQQQQQQYNNNNNNFNGYRK